MAEGEDEITDAATINMLAHDVEARIRFEKRVENMDGLARRGGAPWESLQYYPLRDFWCDGKQMISA